MPKFPSEFQKTTLIDEADKLLIGKEEDGKTYVCEVSDILSMVQESTLSPATNQPIQVSGTTDAVTATIANNVQLPGLPTVAGLIPQSDNTSKIATTAFVQNLVSGLGLPGVSSTFSQEGGTELKLNNGTDSDTVMKYSGTDKTLNIGHTGIPNVLIKSTQSTIVDSDNHVGLLAGEMYIRSTSSINMVALSSLDIHGESGIRISSAAFVGLTSNQININCDHTYIVSPSILSPSTPNQGYKVLLIDPNNMLCMINASNFYSWSN